MIESQICRPLQTDEQLFFWDIPQTAGISLKQLIDKQFHPSEILADISSTAQFQQYSQESLLQYRFLHGNLPYFVTEVFGKSPAKMIMLRDPYLRAMSYFGYIRRTKKHRLHGLANEAGALGFFEQLSNRESVMNPYTYLLGASYENQPMSEVDFDLVLQRLDQFVFVGIAEHFLQSVFLLAYTFAWLPTDEGVMFNPEIEHDITKLSPEIIDIVTEYSHLDIALYEHSTTIFRERYIQMLYEIAYDSHKLNSTI